MISPLELSVEQYSLLHAKSKKDLTSSSTRSLTNFGLQEDIIPPAVFPRVELTQKKVDEL